MTSRDDPTRKTQRLTEIASGYKSARTFIGAIETGLFTVISEGAATVETIAGKLELPVETADRLVIGCKALDLIVESDGVIRNQDDVERAGELRRGVLGFSRVGRIPDGRRPVVARPSAGPSDRVQA